MSLNTSGNAHSNAAKTSDALTSDPKAASRDGSPVAGRTTQRDLINVQVHNQMASQPGIRSSKNTLLLGVGAWADPGRSVTNPTADSDNGGGASQRTQASETKTSQSDKPGSVSMERFRAEDLPRWFVKAQEGRAGASGEEKNEKKK